jgi:hypothetical protein
LQQLIVTQTAMLRRLWCFYFPTLQSVADSEPDMKQNSDGDGDPPHAEIL